MPVFNPTTPATTPTTPHVLARERVPAMFRPSNQANMEPAQASNPSATQSFLPSLGNVRSGNGYDDNALAAEGESFTRMVNKKRVVDTVKQESAGELRKRLAQIESQIQGAAARGQDMPARKLKQLQERKRQILVQLANMGGHQARIQHGGRALPPWEMGAKIKRFSQYKKMPWRQAPATPPALNYEPVGVSSQQNREQILAMQQNIQPIKRMKQSPAAAMEGWATDEMIPGVPNYVLAAGGGLLAVLLLSRLRRRKIVVIGGSK